jgi:hypothetical protein
LIISPQQSFASKGNKSTLFPPPLHSCLAEASYAVHLFWNLAERILVRPATWRVGMSGLVTRHNKLVQRVCMLVSWFVESNSIVPAGNIILLPIAKPNQTKLNCCCRFIYISITNCLYPLRAPTNLRMLLEGQSSLARHVRGTTIHHLVSSNEQRYHDMTKHQCISAEVFHAGVFCILCIMLCRVSVPSVEWMCMV